MSLQRHPILIFVLVLCGSGVASAQPTATATATPAPKANATATPIPVPATSPSPSASRELKVTAVYCSPPPPKNEPWKTCEAGIGDRIVVVVEGLSDSVKNGDTKTGDLVLFLGGNPLKSVKAIPIDDSALNRLAFDLERTDSSSSAWSGLLAEANLQPTIQETVSVGAADKRAVPSGDPNNPPTISLRVYNRKWAFFSLGGLLLTLIFFVFLAKTTGVIRDSGPPLLASTKRPYSLSRVQAAFWFFLVIGSFILLYLITGDYNTITDQALMLMGIGTGTALGSAMIDATKNDTANNALSDLNPQKARLESEVTELTTKVADLQRNQTQLEDTIKNAGAAATAADKEELSNTKTELSTTKTNLSGKVAELTETDKKIATAESGMSKPASEGFGRDLLTDVDGINFHRFQMVVWTIVLGFLFCLGVYRELAMPQFSGTLLALMGISAGTYLGFKIPEKQN